MGEERPVAENEWLNRMKMSLDHLPAAKQQELKRVTEMISQAFAEARKARKAPRLKNGRLLKIILFGSYARGDWVQDPVGRYFSDFDLLVVVDHDDLTNVPEFWQRLEDELLREVSTGGWLRTPVSLIYHSISDVNEQLAKGRYFFIDILRDGIELHSEPGTAFAAPHPLSPQQALEQTREYFEEWFESADQFLGTAEFAISRGWLKKAAFDLHQAAERLYHTLFLVRSLYSPKTHNLNRLRTLAEDLEPQLTQVWPKETKFERRCYELIRAAYVRARYSRQYRITPDELAWLKQRVHRLRHLVLEASLRRLADLERGG
jgi:predicted nucleotidyltransferase/HEPN domain-containing protein